MITVKEMISKKEMKQFVMFPFSIYKNNPYWVPPIITEELETLNKDCNPAFENAEARFFVAIKNKKIVVLDIPLLLENKINEKKDILVYVQSKKSFILRRLKMRKNFNQKLLKKFKSIQLPISYKRKKSQFIIKNDFTKKSVRNGIKNILKEIT